MANPMMDAMSQGASPEGSAPAASAKAVMITAKDDGTFEIQAMTDGAPSGEATQAPTIDDAIQGAKDALGAAPEGSPAEEGGETPAEESSEPPSEDATDPEAEAKAQYASKRGTRPKTMPNWGDYMTGGNPTAK